MYYDHHRLGSDESFDRSNATGHFEEALQELVYEGIASCTSTEADVDEGAYFVSLNDDTTVLVRFDFTAPDEKDAQEVTCEWAHYPTLDRGAGTWREAAAWLKSAARDAAEKGARQQSPPPGRS